MKKVKCPFCNTKVSFIAITITKSIDPFIEERICICPKCFVDTTIEFLTNRYGDKLEFQTKPQSDNNGVVFRKFKGIKK